MASYTMQLREIIEQVSQYEDLSMKERIEVGRQHLFNFQYPIFDEEYRKIFETHFIRTFYMREIGTETEELFKFNLETWLSVNMPYFNKLFESELLQFDPLSNSKMDVTHTKKSDLSQSDNKDIVKVNTENGQVDHVSDQTSSATGRTNTGTDSQFETNESGEKDTTGQRLNDNFERDLESNNPDSRLTITTDDGQGVIEYASKINEQNANNKENTTNQTNESKVSDGSDHTTTTGTSLNDGTFKSVDGETSIRKNEGNQNEKLVSNIDEIEDFVQHRVGKIGVQSYSKLLMDFRLSFVRVEKQIFDEMQELFMLAY